MTAKHQLQRLIEDLPESLAGDVLDFVQALQDKKLQAALTALNEAPLEDEDISPEEDAEAAAALADHQQHGGFSSDEIKARYLA